MRDGFVPSKNRWRNLDNASEETKRILEGAMEYNDGFRRLLRPWDYYDDLPKRRIIDNPEKITEQVVTINEELSKLRYKIFSIGDAAADVEEERERRIYHRGILWGRNDPWRMW